MKRYKVTHIMNTKQLGLMLVAGLLSFGASAQVDLNPVPPLTAGTVMLAGENEIDSDGTEVSGAAYNVTGEAGFIIPQMVKRTMHALTLEVVLSSVRLWLLISLVLVLLVVHQVAWGTVMLFCL